MSVRSLWCSRPAHVVCVLADRMSRNLVVRKKKKEPWIDSGVRSQNQLLFIYFFNKIAALRDFPNTE